MKNIFQILCFVTIAASMLFLGSCQPTEADAVELGLAPSNVSFTITEKPGEMNVFILTSTTPDAFLYQWDFGNGTSGEGEEVEVFYQLMGDYPITLRAFNQGGFGESTQMISIAEDVASPCLPNSVLEFMTGCGETTWILEPVGGAYWVGPDDATTWWSNSADDVAARPCAFDDRWTFNSEGVMIYDTQGQLWAEDFMGFNFECVDDSALAPEVAPWASGTHAFGTTDGAINQLTVIGFGAFMGLPKAANDQEITSPSVGQVTYDIIEMGETATGKFMTLEVFMGAGFWRFRYITE